MPDEFPTLRLPVKKLSLRADLRIRMRLWKAAFQQNALAAIGSLAFSPTFVTAIILIFIVPIGSMGFHNHVYASPSILPGDMLYSYKRSIELGRLRKMKQPSERAKYYLDLSGRRMEELEYAVASNQKIAWFMQDMRPGLVPKAHAMSPQKKSIVLSIDKSAAAGLMVESSQFVGLSIQEAQKIKQQPVRRNLLEQTKKTIEQNAKTLKTIDGKIGKDKAETKQTAQVVQKVNVEHHKQLHKALADSQEPEEVELDIIWLDTPQPDSRAADILVYFDAVEELEEEIEDALEEFEEAIEEILEETDLQDEPEVEEALMRAVPAIVEDALDEALEEVFEEEDLFDYSIFDLEDEDLDLDFVEDTHDLLDLELEDEVMDIEDEIADLEEELEEIEKGLEENPDDEELLDLREELEEDLLDLDAGWEYLRSVNDKRDKIINLIEGRGFFTEAVLVDIDLDDDYVHGIEDVDDWIEGILEDFEADQRFYELQDAARLERLEEEEDLPIDEDPEDWDLEEDILYPEDEEFMDEEEFIDEEEWMDEDVHLWEEEEELPFDEFEEDEFLDDEEYFDEDSFDEFYDEEEWE